MEHVKYDLGTLHAGSTVIVSLNQQANVLLLDASNYRTYSSGRGGQFRYNGGLVKTSPFRLRVPSTGHWYVAIDLGGYPGTVRSGVTVEPPPRGALPAARDAGADLHRIRQTAPQPPPAGVMDGRVWDVFVSHATEDKDAVARPLADALRQLGVDVWLDEMEMRVGDSVRRKIDQGISASRFGIVIFSQTFFAKGWTQYELDGLVTRTVAGEQNLLPIWHDITHDEVMRQSPSLADKVALSTFLFTLDEIAAQIAEVVMQGAGRG